MEQSVDFESFGQTWNNERSILKFDFFSLCYGKQTNEQVTKTKKNNESSEMSGSDFIYR